MTGRNEPCSCGSGRKFKECCGRTSPPPPQTAAPESQEIGALVELVNQGRLREAANRARELLRTQPGAGLLWKVLGVALLRQGGDAVPALERAAALLPQDEEAQANLGAALHDRGQWEPALVALRRALALNPRHAEAMFNAGNAQLALGRLPEAVKLYHWSVEIDPRRREAHNNLGNALLQLGDRRHAIACYRRALELKPDDGQVLCNLGNALREDGQMEAALECSRRAVEFAPDLAMAHNTLGVLLAASGQTDQAIACHREALRLNPRYVEALNSLGDALQEKGARREAIACYEQAVTLDPRRPDSFTNLGFALLHSRQTGEAESAFQSALAIAPSAAAHRGLAGVLRILADPQGSERHARAALAMAPDSPEALTLVGELHADRGEFEQAHASFARAIGVDAAFTPAYASIAAHRRMTAADGPWLEAVQKLLAGGVPLAQQIHLRYALGKYFDDTGSYDAAFANYVAANELSKRYGAPFEPSRFTQFASRIVGYCDAKFVRRAHTGASASPRPLFIIGMPRSGTSLTEQILASHPDVYGAGEVRFWDRIFTEMEKPGLAGEAADAALARAAEAYLAQVGAGAGEAARITDKMPANFLYAGLIHAALPQARFIHMQRHPLDTCLSVYFQNFFNVSPYAHDLKHLAHYYTEYLRLMHHWRSVLPPSVLLEVPYEGLIADQEGWTRRMLKFAGLPWDPRCLDFQNTPRVVMTASKWQVRQKINSASAGRWRHYEKHVAPLAHLVGLAPAFH